MKTKIEEFSKRMNEIKENLQNEEATKTSLVLPFFAMLGYDIFNPNEFIPEFTCDTGIKKGEKVDYAIRLNDRIVMVIEVKKVGYDLNKVDSQLARYFHVSDAQIAIMTDGVIYKLYSDLEKTNVLDSKPFFEFDLSNINDQQISDIEKFHKSNFSVDSILNLASQLRNINQIKEKINKEFSNPSDDFIRYLINDMYDGVKTKQVIDSFVPVVKKAFFELINDKIAVRFNNAINYEFVDETESVNEIDTTDDEMQFYQIIKALLIDVADIERITYKDTRSYFTITYDMKITKWICRVEFLKGKSKEIKVSFNNDTSIKILSVQEIYNYKNEIIECYNKLSIK